MSFYLITRLDAIVAVSIIFAIILLICAIVGLFMGLIEGWFNKDNQEDRSNVKIVRSTAIAGFFFLLMAVFVPDTKTACAIYFVNYLQDNEDARELPDKVLKSANLYFDKLIEDLDNKEDDYEKATK